MEIKLKALKFDAGEKLVAFVEKKVSRLEKFFLPGVAPETEVTLEDVKEGKKAKLHIHLPGTTSSSKKCPTLSRMQLPVQLTP